MLKFELVRQLRLLEEAEGRRITWGEVSEKTGISTSVLSNLASWRPGVATNTRYVESLCRFFRCTPNDMLTMIDTPGAGDSCNVNDLYPSRADT